MPKNLSHEEIAQRFVDAKVIDFGAAGKLIAELGPILAVTDLGWHGFNFGRFNSHACFLPAADVARLMADVLLTRRPPERVRDDVVALRRRFQSVHFVSGDSAT